MEIPQMETEKLIIRPKLGMNYEGTAELENKKWELFGIGKEEFLNGRPSGKGL